MPLRYWIKIIKVIQVNLRFKGLIDGQNIDDKVKKDSQIQEENR